MRHRSRVILTITSVLALILGLAAPAAAAEPQTATGTVLTDAGEAIEEAQVTLWQKASDPLEGEEEGFWDTVEWASTDGAGVYSFELEPGATYTIEAWAPAHLSTFLGGASGPQGAESFTLESLNGGPIPELRLQKPEPVLNIEVFDATFGGGVSDATVVLSQDGAIVTSTPTDMGGSAQFFDLAPGQYSVEASKAGYLPTGEPLVIDYAGGHDWYQLSLDLNIVCEPAQANQGLSNMGFENGLDGWTVAFETEGVEIVGADDFAAPWEGDQMARLGAPQASSEENQALGTNLICQDFVVTEIEENFAFNIFTYDYTGFDDFRFDVVVTAPSTGERLAFYSQGAWGPGGNTDLKTTGWRGAKLNLDGHVGETVRLSIRAGGTQDTLFAFWAYVDSAEERQPATVESTVRDIETTTGSVTTDPTTGQWTASFPVGQPSDLTLTFDAVCTGDEQTPSSAALLLNGQSYPASLVSGATYKATIPSDGLANGQVTRVIECDGTATLVDVIGHVVLYDPSGNVTDAVTGDPVKGAEVHLYKVEGWAPQSTPGGAIGDGFCQTNESKGDGPWDQPAPTAEGTLVNAASPEISPNVNPFVTNDAGYYGWDVAEGCWYVIVTAEGYQDLVSPVVGVPSEVTDLHLALTPTTPGVIVAGAPKITGEAKVGSTLSVEAGSWEPNDVTLVYQWKRNGAAIAGATDSSYKLVTADAGKSIVVTVTGSKAGFAPVSTSSNAVSVQKQVAKPDPKPVVPSFVDVPKNHKFAEEIGWMASTGLSTGVSQGGKKYYQPSNKVTREAMAAFLYRLNTPKNASAPDGYKVPAVSPFADVSKNHKFYKEIAWMHQSGLSTGIRQVSGKPNYAPKDGVSREAMAAFMFRMDDTKSYQAPKSSPFADVQPGHKFYTQIVWMYDSKLSTGVRQPVGKPQYQDKAQVSREAMAAFLYRSQR